MLTIKNNILHLIDTLWLGGAQQVVRDLFEANNNFDGFFLLVLRETQPMIEVRHPHVNIVKDCGKWQFAKPLKKALQLINLHRIKTLHCHLPKSQLLGLIIKKFYHKKMRLVFHEQGDIMGEFPVNWPVYSLGYSQIDKVVCCSALINKTILKRTPLNAHKLVVIHNFNGFEETYSDVAPVANCVRSSHEYHIGFAGRIIKRKGWKDLLHACVMLNEEITDRKIIVHICGTGPQESLLRKEIKRLNGHLEIRMYGYVENMRLFYKNLDVLSVPSLWEPLGMVHMEVMHFGVPVIASDVPGMNEILKHEDNALLFKAGDVRALKEALKKLIDAPLLYQELSLAGKKTAIENNYSKFEKRIQLLYNTLEV